MKGSLSLVWVSCAVSIEVWGELEGMEEEVGCEVAW